MANQPLINKISENYEMLKVLGRGCYGQVIQCFRRDTEETVAVKVLRQRHSQSSNVREVFILEKLRCLDPDKSSIVRCHESFHRMERTFLVFEILDMSLFDYFCKTKCAPLPLNGIRIIIKDVATALNALKGVGLIHTDLKLDNIMLVDHERQPFRVKLIDFGLTIQTSEARAGLCIQPLWYRSPEIILGLPFSEAIDIWSLGSLMAEMLLGFPLFPGKHVYDVLYCITDLLGNPSNTLLNNGKNTGMFYNGRSKYAFFMHWTFKTPLEFHLETKIKHMDTRKQRFSSLDELKMLSPQPESSTEAADRNACVELLKELLQIDQRNRITPGDILARPFITGSYRSPSSSFQKETTDAESSMDEAVSDTKDAAETKADDSEPSSRSPTKLPSGVIMVLPAETMQRKDNITHDDDISPQAAQSKMTDTLKAKDDHKSEPRSDCDITHDSGPDGGGPGPAVDSVVTSIQFLSPDSYVETSLRTPEVHKPKEKKRKEGIPRFFSASKRTFFSCFCVPSGDDK